VGQTLVRVDPRYFRPTEVELLLGDPTKAREALGWAPKTRFADLVDLMVDHDRDEARAERTLRDAGLHATVPGSGAERGER